MQLLRFFVSVRHYLFMLYYFFLVLVMVLPIQLFVPQAAIQIYGGPSFIHLLLFFAFSSMLLFSKLFKPDFASLAFALFTPIFLESLQFFVPLRYFELPDLIVNICSVLLSIALFSMLEKAGKLDFLKKYCQD